LETVLVLLLAVSGLEIGGPVIGTKVGVILDLDPLDGPDLDGTVGVVGGWAFRDPTTLLPDVPEDLPALHPTVRFDIAAPDVPVPLGGASTRWSRRFDVQTDDGAAAVVLDDGGFVVVESSQYSWLAALDAVGLPVWQYQYPTSDGWSPASLGRASDGDLVVVGNSGTALRVDRFDGVGSPRWTRTLRVPDGDWTRMAAALSTEGRTIVAGDVIRSSVSSPLLAAVDAAGVVEWSIEVDLGPGATFPTITDLAATPSGDIIATGAVSLTDTSDPESVIDRDNALILRLSADGRLQSAYALGGGAGEEGMRIAVHPDGSYIVAGHIGVAPNVWLASLRPDDTLRWSAAYQNRPDEDDSIEHANPTGLAPVADNGILVSGYIGSPDMDAFLMRVDDEGMPLWVKSLVGEVGGDELTEVVALPDGFVAVGRTESADPASTDGDIWVVRGPVDGMLHFTGDSALAAVNTAVEWTRIIDHTMRQLDPAPITTSLAPDPEATLAVGAVEVFGELLT
jgi:hypothetical protein